MVSLSKDKSEILNFLSKDKCSSLYFIADLSDADFERCSWYIHKKADHITALLLVYPHPASDTILTVGEPDGIESIVTEAVGDLPHRFHTHFFLEHEQIFRQHLNVSQEHLYVRMCLDVQKFRPSKDSDVVRLQEKDHNTILELLKVYPENFYTKDQLTNGYYYGAFQNSELIAVCGTHVVSKEHGIAALGNIVTSVNHRNKGHSKRCVSATIESLLPEVTVIGLNVKASNTPAIRVYSDAGFVEHRRLHLAYCEKR